MSANNPFSLALNFQRELLESTVKTVQKSTIADEQLERIERVDVGETPSEVVYEENKLELLHYEPLTDEQHRTPILVAFALINKPFILDLQPDRSVVRRLLEAGHDVYLIDWNEPSRLDRHLTIDDYVNRYIDSCVDVARERSGVDRINLLGYCMGGAMTAMYTALHQQKIRALGLMTAGLCFDDTGGVLELWGDNEYYDPRDVVDVYGNVPSEMLDVGFALMDPVANYVSKYVRLYDNLENDEFVENFARMEQWLDEGIDLAGETYVQFLEDIYQDNKLHKNELYLGDKHVDITDIEVPIIQIIGEYDHLIPPETSKPFNDVVGSEDIEMIEYPTGHIGMSVSRSTHRDVWPRVAEWFVEKSTDDPEHLEAVERAVAEATDQIVIEEIDVEIETGTETELEEGVEIKIEGDADGSVRDPGDTDPEPAGTDVPDIETREIDGVGPTYAERLSAAGIETVGELADADAETVSRAAEVSETRAEDWLEQAKERSD